MREVEHECGVPLVCQICGGEGADTTGGVGDVVGVPIHASCWHRLPGGAA